VWVEGILMVKNLDIVKVAGKNFTAYSLFLQKIAVQDGYLSIELSTVAENPFITGIEVFYSSWMSNRTMAPNVVGVPVKTPSSIPLSTKAPYTKAPMFPVPVAASPVGRWVEVNASASITARHEACFVMVDNPKVGRKAYLVGGRGIKNTDVYDPITRIWTTKQKPPIEIHHIQCVAAAGLLWVMAAWTGSYPKETNAPNVYVYDPALNQWYNKTALPLSRRRGSAAVIVSHDQTKIYVSHGNSGGHELADFATSLGYLDVYNIATDTWDALSDDAPHPRDHTGGAMIQNRICIAGGRNGGEITWPEVAPTDCYNLDNGIWEVEASIPQTRSGSSYGKTCDGKLIVAGGEGNSSTFDRVDVFNGTTWNTIDNLVVARHGTGLAVDCVCNQIHIASGSASAGSGLEIQSVETYFPNGIDTPCRAPITTAPVYTKQPAVISPIIKAPASPTIIIPPPKPSQTIPTVGPPTFQEILINCGGKFFLRSRESSFIQ
jgi:hypothetical protein